MSQGPRVLRPERGQLRWEMVDLDSQLPPEHRARLVWSFVAGLDLSEFYARIKARDDTAGRPASDPAVLLADGTAMTQDEIVGLAEHCPGLTVYTPLPRERDDVTAETLRKRKWQREHEA